MAKATKSTTGKKSTDKRTTITPNGDKRYIKRNEKGQIKESDDVGKSLSADVKRHAKTEVEPGYGDQGDQPAKKSTAKSTVKKSAGK